MSEQGLDEIVQITVEDFDHDDHTGKISAERPKNMLCCFSFIS